MLTDRFRRTIDYMRISVTDRCNLRCVYCMPRDGVPPIHHENILRYEEIVRIVQIAVREGVTKIRITGGEPLVRKDIPHLISMIRSISGIKDLSMTTNGILLKGYAQQLADAGLTRINISLDSLSAKNFSSITRGGNIQAVLAGIEAAEKARFNPIKINMVPIRGMNDNEIVDFAKLTLHRSLEVRFIEHMPFGLQEMWRPEGFISSDSIKTIVNQVGLLKPAKAKKSSTARYYKFSGASGSIGFISPLSNHFCDECNRLRLTADGKIRPCLFSETEIDLKPSLRIGNMNEVSKLIRLSVHAKPSQHPYHIQKAVHPHNCAEIINERFLSLSSSVKQGRPMFKIGG